MTLKMAVYVSILINGLIVYFYQTPATFLLDWTKNWNILPSLLVGIPITVFCFVMPQVFIFLGQYEFLFKRACPNLKDAKAGILSSNHQTLMFCFIILGVLIWRDHLIRPLAWNLVMMIVAILTFKTTTLMTEEIVESPTGK